MHSIHLSLIASRRYFFVELVRVFCTFLSESGIRLSAIGLAPKNVERGERFISVAKRGVWPLPSADLWDIFGLPMVR